MGRTAHVRINMYEKIFAIVQNRIEKPLKITKYGNEKLTIPDVTLNGENKVAQRYKTQSKILQSLSKYRY